MHFRQTHVGRYRAPRPQLAGDDRPVRGALIIRLLSGIEARLWEITGEHVMIGRTMIGVVMPERANKRELVHLPRRARLVLADLNARYIGGDWLELPAKLRRCIRLEVPGVHGAQAAVQEQEDKRYIFRRAPLFRRPGALLEQ